MNRHLGRISQFVALMMLLAVALVGMPAPIVRAATKWYVSPSGNDLNSCRSVALACRTIGAVVARTAPGDTVVIAPGTYSENLTIDHSLLLRGAGAGATTIDGGGRAPVLRVTGGPTFLEGLTITNGGSDLATNEGGGIRS